LQLHLDKIRGAILPYYSLWFHHVMLDKEWHQPAAVVNYPQSHDYIRVTEDKHHL
jgi:UDP-galactopyranose mutase